MSEDRRWLMAWLTRLKLAELHELAESVPPAYADETYAGYRKKDIIAWLERSRANYWDIQHAKAQAGEFQTKSTVKPGLPASEVDAFLRDMPPMPFWPDRCQCVLCREGG